MGSKSIEEDGIGEEMGEAVDALLKKKQRIWLEFTRGVVEFSFTKSLKKAQDGWINILESCEQCWEMLEIYCYVLHSK